MVIDWASKVKIKWILSQSDSGWQYAMGMDKPKWWEFWKKREFSTKVAQLKNLLEGGVVAND